MRLRPQIRMRQGISTLDFLRVLAAFFVIMLHTSSGVVTTNPDIQSATWWTGNLFDSYSRWCVPVFVMISGTLLLPPSPDTQLLPFYRRRLIRIGIPLLFWTCFYWGIRYLSGEPLTIKAVVKSFATTGSSDHLWYLYMLIGLVLATPFLRLITAAASDVNLRLLWAGLFLLFSIEMLYDKEQSATFLSLCLPYIAYFLAGYHLRAMPVRVPGSVLILVFLLSGLLVSLFTWALYPKLGSRSWDIMYAYLNPLVIVMSLSVFMIFEKYSAAAKPFEAAVKVLAPMTLGIYVIHPAWLSLFYHNGLNAFIYHPLVAVPTITAVAFALSALCTAALLAIPGVRRIVA